MIAWNSVTWDVARAGGFVAYGLVTASVALGLLVSMKWRSTAWPRFLTTEVHRFVTLLALVFTGIHTLAVLVDPFIRFTPAEVFVPFLSHYRPIWIALGIVGTYLLIAIWVSDWLRPFVGYAWWRRFHTLAFVTFALAAIHGIGTGSDSRAPWAMAFYGATIFVVAALVAVRLLPEDPKARRRPGLALAGFAGVLLATFWAFSGPFRPGWNAIANNGNGSGGSGAALAATTVGAPAATPAPTVNPFAGAIQADFSGTVSQASDGSGNVDLEANLTGGASGHLRIVLGSQDSPNPTNILVLTAGTSGPACQGSILGGDDGRLSASCTAPDGTQIRIQLRLRVSDSGAVEGSISGGPASGAVLPPQPSAAPASGTGRGRSA